jgi:hypothetical protein
MRSMVEGRQSRERTVSADAAPTGQIIRAPPETIANARRLRRSLSPQRRGYGGGCGLARRGRRSFAASIRLGLTCSTSTAAELGLRLRSMG